jgi:hypothetical protein
MKIDTLKFDEDTRTLLEAIANGFNPTEIESSSEDSLSIEGGVKVEFEKSSNVPGRILEQINSGKYSEEQIEKVNSNYPTKSQWRVEYRIGWISIPSSHTIRSEILSVVATRLREKFNIDGLEYNLIRDISVEKKFDTWAEAKQCLEYYTEFHKNNGDEIYKQASKLVNDKINSMGLWFKFNYWLQEHSVLVIMQPPFSFFTRSYYSFRTLKGLKFQKD